MTDLQHRIVIVGAGHAGVQAADSLRAEGFQGNIVLLDVQQEMPYQRPSLSKDFLTAQKGDAKALPLKGDTFYEHVDVELHVGCEVLEIDREQKSLLVQFADQTRSTLQYETLVLATGAEARQLEVSGVNANGIFELRTQSDAKVLRSQLEGAQRIVVVGAGFIGLEFAAAARSQGKTVTVVEFAERPMTRALTEPLSLWIAEAHRAMGTELKFGLGVTGFETDKTGNVRGVITQDGGHIVADMVLLGVGVTPRTELAEKTGLQLDNGIAVDPTLRTSDPAIFAIGDCAAFPYGPEHSVIRLESVQNATDQARHIAKAIVHDSHAEYSTLPVFWSHQGSIKLQIAGLLNFGDQAEIDGDPSSGKFSVRASRYEELVVVESVNQPKVHMQARRALANKSPMLVQTP